jgi:hypothetical protein
MIEFRRIKWTFYMKTIVLGVSTQWREITHEKAQDICYQAGCISASVQVKRMMRYSNANVMVGNIIIKMEAME